MKRVCHDIQAVDGNLGAFASLREEQYLLIQPEVPVVVAPSFAGHEVLLQREPQLGVVQIRTPRRLCANTYCQTSLS